MVKIIDKYVVKGSGEVRSGETGELIGKISLLKCKSNKDIKKAIETIK